VIALFNSKSNLDRTFDAILGHELRKLNTHLPKQRRKLSELLSSDDPTVEAADGSSIVLKTAELEELANIVPKEYHDQVKLPFTILRRMELGRSVYTVTGDKIEQFTLKKILGTATNDFQHIYKENESAFFYRPQVVELIRRFHSLVVIGFGVPKELADYVPNRV
jgi:uncharacterized protein (UPF0216 family)